MAFRSIGAVSSKEKKPAKARLQAILDFYSEAASEGASRADRERSERDRTEDEYREAIQEAIARQERQLENDHLDEMIGQRVADAAEARLLYAGKNALKQSPHLGERVSAGEIDAIDRMDHPLLLKNHAALAAMRAERHAILEQMPPEDRLGPEAYHALLKTVRPRAMDTTGSSYSPYSSMPDTMRRELRMGLVKQLIERADEDLAAERVKSLEAQDVTDEERLDEAGKTFHWVARDLTRKRRRGETITDDDMELIATRRLELMEGVRELNPPWGPEKRADWLNTVDNHVFDISLAAVPDEPRDSALYQGAQNLKQGDPLLTLRAADLTNEALGQWSENGAISES